MGAATCQRWRDRRERHVPAGPLINPADYAVDVIEERHARPFVIQHHYAGTFPAARLSVGLFRRAELVGVAVFSVPMNNRAIPHYTGLAAANDGAELGRLVLLDDVPGMGESWFLSRALSLARREKRLKAVLSYSDPVERRAPCGRLIKPGHIGVIYKALSARYHGLSGRRTGYVTAAGVPVSGRALSKIRLEEQGHDYAVGQLLKLGMPRPALFERSAAWLDRLVADGLLRRVTHPGNHAYTFPITREARRLGGAVPVVDYPRKEAA